MALSDALSDAIHDIQATLKGSSPKYCPEDIEAVRRALVELRIVQFRIDLPPQIRKSPEELRKLAVDAIYNNK